MAYTHANALNKFGVTALIVATSAANGSHTTLAGAMADAVSGDTIFLRDSVTENVTITPGVNIAAWSGGSSNTPTITGTLTMSGAGTSNISGLKLQTNSAALIAVTGSAASILNVKNCYLNCTNNSGITYSTSNASAIINIKDCNGDLGTTGIAFFAHSSAGAMYIDNSFLSNSGGSSTANTISSGSITIFYSIFLNPLTSSSTASLGMSFCGIDTSAQNVTCITSGGSGSHGINFSALTSGSASGISISNTTGMNNSFVNSSNTNAITGAGTLLYTNLVLPSSKKINTTTQTGGVAKGGETQAPSVGFIGEQIRSYNGSGTAMTSTVPGNITSISLTAGVWDVSGLCYYTYSAEATTNILSIGVNSATADGNGGDFLVQMGTAGTEVSLAIPSARVVLTTTTTYYLVYTTVFPGTGTAYGRISATRVG